MEKDLPPWRYPSPFRASRTSFLPSRDRRLTSTVHTPRPHPRYDREVR